MNSRRLKERLKVTMDDNSRVVAHTHSFCQQVSGLVRQGMRPPKTSVKPEALHSVLAQFTQMQ